MKQLRRVPLIMVGIGTVFVGGLAAWLISLPIVPVTVMVKNTSAKGIISVKVEHERRVETVENLPRGEARTIQFKAGGETPYRLRVRFADGSELAGGGGYAEAGYEFSETVGDSAIKTGVRLPVRY